MLPLLLLSYHRLIVIVVAMYVYRGPRVYRATGFNADTPDESGGTGTDTGWCYIGVCEVGYRSGWG